ncbi:hypothetical protein ACOSQ2_001218 [Xanthoceras sorbifolium]
MLRYTTKIKHNIPKPKKQKKERNVIVWAHPDYHAMNLIINSSLMWRTTVKRPRGGKEFGGHMLGCQFHVANSTSHMVFSTRVKIGGIDG